jgi:diacylglycerol kinase (ATP)
MKKWVKSANLAIEGIIYAIKSQRHMRLHLFAALAALILGLVLHISRTDLILLCMAIVLVLATEMLNTAIETMVDMISEDYHPMAKNAKDIAAGVVLIASIGALTLGYLILYPAFKEAILAGNWHLHKTPNDVVAFVSLAVVIILVIMLKTLFGTGEPLRGGMPSGHAAVSFSVWTAALYLTDSLPIILLTFLLAVMVSWSRWSSGIHRPIEVITGALLGIAVTFLLFRLFT